MLGPGEKFSLTLGGMRNFTAPFKIKEEDVIPEL